MIRFEILKKINDNYLVVDREHNIKYTFQKKSNGNFILKKAISEDGKSIPKRSKIYKEIHEFVMNRNIFLDIKFLYREWVIKIKLFIIKMSKFLSDAGMK